MKKYKIIFMVNFILLLSVLLTGCFSDRVYLYEEISDYVLENIDDLEDLICDNDGFDSSVHFDYKEYLGSRTIVKRAFSYTTEIIKFYCGGEGLVTDSKDSGFYYSENDTSYGMEFDQCPQTTEENGSVTYHSSDGISFLSTKKICPHWFYYYMEWH